jgi:integrase
MSASEIEPHDVRRWLLSLTGSPKTKRNLLSLVRGALRAAVEAGVLSSDPSLVVSFPRSAKHPEPWAWLTSEEIDALLAAADAHQERLFTTAIFTGCRAGELWALRWRDVDLDRGILHVRSAVGEGGRIGPPKSGRARAIPLLSPVVRALESSGARETFVFPGRHGLAHPTGYRADFHRVLGRANIERPVRFHDLRHTCASHLIQGSWVPDIVRRPLRLEEIQQWLGHASRASTERYAHLSPDGLRSLAVRAGEIVG